MPVPGAKGLYGGYIKGKQDKQTYRSNEASIAGKNIQNMTKFYEFQEYKANRSTRDKMADVQDIKSETITENEDQIKANAKQDLEFSYQAAKMEMTVAQNEVLAGVSQFIAEQGGAAGITEDTYATMYNHIVSGLAGEGGDTAQVTEMLEEQFKLSPEWTPGSVQNLADLTSLAEHDSKTGRAGHLARIKAKMTALYGGGANPYKPVTEAGKNRSDSDYYMQKANAALASGQSDMAQEYYNLAQAMKENANSVLSKEQMEQHSEEIKFAEGIIKSMPGATAAAMDGDYDPSTLATVRQTVAMLEEIHPNAYKSDIQKMIWQDYEWDGNVWGHGRLVPKSFMKQAEDIATASAQKQLVKLNHSLIPLIEAMNPEKTKYVVEYLNEEAIRLNILKPTPLPAPFEEQVQSTATSAGAEVTVP